MKEILKFISDNVIELKLHMKCYTREAITSTAYTFTDKNIITIDQSEPPYWDVRIISKENKMADLSLLIEAFLRDLIDNQIRDDLERRTNAIRQIIVEQAFAPIDKLKEKKNSKSNFTQFSH